MARDALELMDHIGAFRKDAVSHKCPFDSVSSASPGWVKERDVHVVGISLGGMIALKLAAINPMRCASLLLAVTTVIWTSMLSTATVCTEPGVFSPVQAGHGIRRKLPPFEGLKTTATNLFDDLERYMLMLYPAEWLDDTDPEDPQGRTNRETRIEEFKSRNKLT